MFGTRFVARAALSNPDVLVREDWTEKRTGENIRWVMIPELCPVLSALAAFCSNGVNSVSCGSHSAVQIQPPHRAETP
jgi:hypothetical protein